MPPGSSSRSGQACRSGFARVPRYALPTPSATCSTSEGRRPAMAETPFIELLWVDPSLQVARVGRSQFAEVWFGKCMPEISSRPRRPRRHNRPPKASSLCTCQCAGSRERPGFTTPPTAGRLKRRKARSSEGTRTAEQCRAGTTARRAQRGEQRRKPETVLFASAQEDAKGRRANTQL
jgi:hypothetical protein